MYKYIYIYIYIKRRCGRPLRERRGHDTRARQQRAPSPDATFKVIHPVSITRFPLSRFSPGAGCSGIHLFTLSTLRFSRGWVRKDGNLLMETGCAPSPDAIFKVIFAARYNNERFPDFRHQSLKVLEAHIERHVSSCSATE